MVQCLKKLKHTGQRTMKLEIEITKVVVFQNPETLDKVYLYTDKIEGTYPYKDELILEFRTANLKGLAFVHKTFPKLTNIEVINTGKYTQEYLYEINAKTYKSLKNIITYEEILQFLKLDASKTYIFNWTQNPEFGSCNTKGAITKGSFLSHNDSLVISTQSKRYPRKIHNKKLKRTFPWLKDKKTVNRKRCPLCDRLVHNICSRGCCIACNAETA